MQKYYKKQVVLDIIMIQIQKKIKASTGHKYNHVVKPLLIDKGILKYGVNKSKVSDNSTDGKSDLAESDAEKTGRGLNLSQLSTSKIDNFLKKLVYYYMNIQKGNLDPENIISILDELKKIDLYANLRSDKYIYWDNLDELLQRLVVLYGEIESGNTNPSLRNEIIRILQELKEL
jgi:hypothetical protein